MKLTTIMNTVVSILNIIIRLLCLSQKALSVQRFVVVMVLFFLLPVNFSRAQIYVDVCAAGPGNGSQADPFNTLASAVAAASPNDIIYMKGGFYPETLTINQALTIIAYDGSAHVGTSGDGVSWRDVIIDLGSGISTNARVYYPSCSQGQLPVVVYAHGYRFQENLCRWCDDALQTDNSKDYLQAEGILKRLASSGIIAISFNWHDLPGTPIDETIANYIIRVIEYLGEEFSDSVNLNNVGLIGHSMGGAAVIVAANRLSDDAAAQIKGVGLIAPGMPLREDYHNLSDTVLVIHGTNDHPCQVGTNPLEIYCWANAPKHLVVLTGANHFGYTDGICLNPEYQRSSPCVNDPWGIPQADGYDNPSAVGGLEGQEAHALQQLAAGNYLWAFFSYYLQGNLDTRDYLVQQQGEKCGYPGDAQKWQCAVKDLEVYCWVPNNPPETLCSSVQIEVREGEEGETLLATHTVDQGVNGGQWNYLGTYNFYKSARVRILSSIGCSVIADAVKFVIPGSLPTEEVIVDNGTLPRTISQGTWNASTQGSDWYGENYLLSSSSDPNGWYEFRTIFSGEFETSNCEPVLYFDDLQSLNVEVNVCSCLE